MDCFVVFCEVCGSEDIELLESGSYICSNCGHIKYNFDDDEEFEEEFDLDELYEEDEEEDEFTTLLYLDEHFGMDLE